MGRTGLRSGISQAALLLDTLGETLFSHHITRALLPPLPKALRGSIRPSR